jgi:hypothetical protein
MEILEQIIVFIAKQGGQHGRLVLYPNRSGAVYNSTGKVLTTFSSLDELRQKVSNAMGTAWDDKVGKAFEEYWVKTWGEHRKAAKDYEKVVWQTAVAWALAEFEKATQVLANTTTKQKEA